LLPPRVETDHRIAVQPDFSLTTTPASRTIVPGSRATYTPTVTGTSGISRTVSLSVSGLPAGASASFSPASISSSGSSALSVFHLDLHASRQFSLMVSWVFSITPPSTPRKIEEFLARTH